MHAFDIGQRLSTRVSTLNSAGIYAIKLHASRFELFVRYAFRRVSYTCNNNIISESSVSILSSKKSLSVSGSV